MNAVLLSWEISTASTFRVGPRSMAIHGMTSFVCDIKNTPVETGLATKLKGLNIGSLMMTGGLFEAQVEAETPIMSEKSNDRSGANVIDD